MCDILLLFATFSTYGYDLSSFFYSKFSVIKTMCTDIVDKWMEKVRGKNNENSGKQGMLNYLGMMQCQYSANYCFLRCINISPGTSSLVCFVQVIPKRRNLTKKKARKVIKTKKRMRIEEIVRNQRTLSIGVKRRKVTE